MLQSFFEERARIGLLLLASSVVAWWLSRPPRPRLEEVATVADQDAAGSAERGRGCRALDPDERQELSLGLLLADQGYFLEPGSHVLPPLPSCGGIGPLRWRPALFAAQRGADMRGGDLYRAEVRLSDRSEVVDLRGVSDLTRSSSSREQLVLAFGPYSLWKMELQGVIQALLLVDARQDERSFEPDSDWRQHLMANVSNRLQTGQWSGVGISLYNLLIPATSVRALRLPASLGEPERIEILLFRGPRNERARVLIDAASRELILGQEEVIHRPRVWAGTPLSHWVVDTVRGFSWVGPRPITLLEKWVFNARNRLLAWGHWFGLLQEQDLAEELGVSRAQIEAGLLRLESGTAAMPDAHWPPPPVAPLMVRPRPGEGQWFPFSTDWLKKLPAAPWAFYKTALHMPGEPPGLVVLVAMDLRQLDLGMAAGISTPWSSTGYQGEGRIPREPERLARTVAAFNGGFQTAHGPFGMMVERELVLEAWQRTATIAVLRDSTLRMGTWNNSIRIPDDMLSFRQNMPPLLQDGVWNPTHRKHWGGTTFNLDGVSTARSAMGYRGQHQLIYAWSESASAEEIAKALLRAGCEYGIHLDMNPYHAGFGLLDIDPTTMDARGRIDSFEAEAPSKAQSFVLRRFVNRNGKDFFYLMLRRTLPELLPAPPPGFSPWNGRVDPGRQDGFLPAAAVCRDPGSRETLVALDLPRLGATFVLGQGDALLLSEGSSPRIRRELLLKLPVALLDLGKLDPERPTGLSAAGHTLFPPSPVQATLGVEPDGALDLLAPRGMLPPASSLPWPESLRQGCPLLVDGMISGRAHALLLSAAGALHHALGLGEDGRLFYLSSPGDARSMGEILEKLGVRDALLLTDGPASRMKLLATEDKGVMAEDPVLGDRIRLGAGPVAQTRIFFEQLPEPPRIQRLRMPDAKLSRKELRRQRRIQAKIVEKRQELRKISNARFQRYVEKIRRRMGEVD